MPYNNQYRRSSRFYALGATRFLRHEKHKLLNFLGAVLHAYSLLRYTQFRFPKVQ